jgi:hypothetical protein
LTRLVPLLGALKHDPLRNREMGENQALGGYQSFKKCNKQPKGNVGSGGGYLRRDTNEGIGDKGGGRATAMRVMATATAKLMTWVMATAMRLVGDEERKGKGGKGTTKRVRAARQW